jgi:hypothetical protein
MTIYTIPDSPLGDNAVIAPTGQRPLEDELGPIIGSRFLAAGIASASVPITPGARALSIRCRLNPARFLIGTGATTAVATSPFIEVNERLTIQLAPGQNTIAAIRQGAADGELLITELG